MRKELYMEKIININEINKAMLEGRDDTAIIDLCKFIDIESCFEPVYEPLKSFLDECRRYWKDYYDKIMKAKPEVPTFYAIDENGVEYFYHGKTRIRVSEHFSDNGKSYGDVAADTIRYIAGNGKKVPLAPAC